MQPSYYPPPPIPMPLPQTSGMAVTGLVCGVVGLVISFIPCMEVFAVILGILGIVFGGIGINAGMKIKAQYHTSNSLGMAIAGLACGIIDLFLPFIIAAAFFSSIH